MAARSLVLGSVVMAAWLAPRVAHATSCNLGPFVLTPDVPLGCELVYASETTPGGEPAAVTVTADRDGQPIDVTGARTYDELTLDVRFTLYDCDGNILQDDVRPVTYGRHRITLVDVRAGDVLRVDGRPAGVVQPSGACTVAAIDAWCTGREPSTCPPPDEVGGAEDDGGGCAVGGTPGAFAALALGVARRRRRR